MLARTEHIRRAAKKTTLSPSWDSHQVFGKGLLTLFPILELMKREDVWLTFEVRPVEAAASSLSALKIWMEELNICDYRDVL